MYDCHLSNIKKKLEKITWYYSKAATNPTPPHPEVHYSEKHIPEFFSLKLTTCLTLIGKIKNYKFFFK